jgi:hypothetical protein
MEMDLEDLFAVSQFATVGGIPLKTAIQNNRELLSSFDSFDPLRLASSFGALLTVPELQSNCLRLETLVHVALLGAAGKRKPNEKTIMRSFAQIGRSTIGRSEDPAEDVFVSLIATPRGNFRILEGIWESGGFHTQRIVNVLEALPLLPQYDNMRSCVYALLRLSDAICERAGVTRNQLGGDAPVGEIPAKFTAFLRSAYRAVRFSESDLSALGIDREYLAPFIFDPAFRERLSREAIGHSSLERHPIAYNHAFHFLLPTAASAAIRRYVIDTFDSMALRGAFVSALSKEYKSLLAKTPLLGEDVGAPVQFQKTSSGLISGVLKAVDNGLYVNFIFFVDNLEGFENDGLVGANSDPTRFAEAVEIWIEQSYQTARAQPQFREMLTLLVGCGIGRVIMNFLLDTPRDRWRCEFASAPDLFTLSWLPDFEALSLWRLLEAKDKLKRLGVTLQNINGLLNLVGWARLLEGHLVPHGSLPAEFGRVSGSSFVLVDQTAIRGVRHEAALAWDAHAALTPTGEWLEVRKDGQALFSEDRDQPYYIALDDIQHQKWRGLYESPLRPWWWEMSVEDKTPVYMAYERSKMLKTWMCRAVPILDPILSDLPKRPILVRFIFQGRIGQVQLKDIQRSLTYADAMEAIEVSPNSTTLGVDLVVGHRFEETLFHVDNIAERALVARILEGLFILSSSAIGYDRDALLNAIVPDTSARQAHAFMTRTFRDYVRHSIQAKPVTIDHGDAALAKLGLGWRARDRSLGADIRSKQECTEFLNRVVKLLEDDVCGELREFNRKNIILRALQNHESAAIDRDNWGRTAAAVLSLHNDKEATLQTIAEHDSELNAIFLSTRILLEFAICESPLEGGREAGDLDVSRLMARVMQIISLGGWSNAIRWDAMPPHIRVTPLGDIHAEQTFQEQVVARFGRTGSDVRVQENIESYAENLEEPKIVPKGNEPFQVEFLDALREEFGATFQVMREFIDAVENLGIEGGQAVLMIPRSTLLNLTLETEEASLEALTALVKALTLEARDSWRRIPDGYDEKDRHPWRFRRRLSALRKPILQIDNGEDPTVIVAPGLLREAFVYMITNFDRGDFPLWQLKPKMKRWAGSSRDRIGHEFNLTVATRLAALGWKTEPDAKVTKLLGRGFDRDFGDVDVLAYSAQNNRMLIIECKDVQYRKTEGEIAEQLADFRGELRADGRPDILMKHLLRMDILRQYKESLGRYVGLKGEFELEGHLVFKNPVPMQFAWKRMEDRVVLHTYSELDRI